jgi:autotransporter-associated beta strand protein
VNKTGAGAWVLGGASTYTGNTTVNAGTLTVAAGGSVASNTVTVASGATLNVNGSLASTAAVTANGTTNFGGTTGITTKTQVLSSLAIGNGVTVSITPSTFPFTPTILKPTTTTYGTGAKIDLTNNAFITTGTAGGALLQIQSGQIFSSQTANPNKAIGYINLSGADAGKFEVRYTLKGDANLDGVVDVGDLGALATAYGLSGTESWANGDFNQDTNVDVGDLGALATNYGTQLGTGPSFGGGLAAAAPLAVVSGGGGASAAVPEPTSLGLIGAAALLSQRRRRRRI